MFFNRTLREHQSNQALLVEKLVTGKLASVPAFLEQESVILKKIDETNEKIRAVVSHLRSWIFSASYGI